MIAFPNSLADHDPRGSAGCGQPQTAEPTSDWNHICRGWLIARVTRDHAGGSVGERFLQLGTGQWCTAAAATWFPVRTAAATYAADLVPESGDQIVVVFRTCSTARSGASRK